MSRRLVLAGIVACSLLGAAPVAAQARATDVDGRRPLLNERPLAAFSLSATTLRDSIVALARAQLGTPYVFGGTNPDRGFDCSGLVKYLAHALNLDVPRTAAQQARVGKAVRRDEELLRPGDLLTFGTGKRVSHIGIYIGDGKFIHASTGAGKVVIADLDRPKARGIKPWQGVRRLILGPDSASSGG